MKIDDQKKKSIKLDYFDEIVFDIDFINIYIHFYPSKKP